jgi:hypothetical protein
MAMTVILVFTTFAAFLVVDRFSNRQAARNELQAAYRAETIANPVPSIVASPVASDAASQDADHPFQVRVGHDRRRGDRRGDRDQSAA